MGLRGAPGADSQYSPFCWPASLMNFCAYCFTPPCFWRSIAPGIPRVLRRYRWRRSRRGLCGARGFLSCQRPRRNTIGRRRSSSAGWEMPGCRRLPVRLGAVGQFPPAVHLLVCLRESIQGRFVFGGIAGGDDVRRSRAKDRKNLILTLRFCGIGQCVACVLGRGEGFGPPGLCGLLRLQAVELVAQAASAKG